MAYRKICVVDKCPEKTSARILVIADNKVIDACKRHTIVIMKLYPEEVEIADTWNELIDYELGD